VVDLFSLGTMAAATRSYAPERASEACWVYDCTLDRIKEQVKKRVKYLLVLGGGLLLELLTDSFSSCVRHIY
jgi:hypothetical protein